MDPRIDYRTPAGEPSLVPPDSPQWRVFKNPVALAIGGVAAVLLEFAEPRIRSGVWDHSTFKTDPLGRSRRTGAAALAGVYAPARTARRMIDGVNRRHAKVTGMTPDQEAYRALDPDLLDWVSATASWGFLAAYDRFVEPVSSEDKNRYYRDGAAVARLYGVTSLIGSDDDFDAMLDTLLPRFEAHPIVPEFLAIVMAGRLAPMVPKIVHRAIARGAVSLLPPAVRTILDLGPAFDLLPLERHALKSAGWLADRYRDRTAPAWQAALRLGLPGDFAWRTPAAQAQVRAERPSLDTAF